MVSRTQGNSILGNKRMLAFLFGVGFLLLLILLAVLIPNQSPDQRLVFRIALALAAAGVAAIIPGFLELKASTVVPVSAGGALAVFAVVYFFAPQMVQGKSVGTPGAYACTVDSVQMLDCVIGRNSKGDYVAFRSPEDNNADFIHRYDGPVTRGARGCLAVEVTRRLTSSDGISQARAGTLEVCPDEGRLFGSWVDGNAQKQVVMRLQ